MRLPLVIEGKGEWASELSSFAEVREGRSRWGRCNNGREIGFHMKIRIASERPYLYYFQSDWGKERVGYFSVPPTSWGNGT
jgi:hypothetical protein